MNKLLFPSLAFVAVSFAACGESTVDLADKASAAKVAALGFIRKDDALKVL